MEWYIDVLRKYAQFSGRARRREYWMFSLVHALVYLALIAVDVIIGSSAGSVGLLSILYIFGTIIPSLAVTVRRLHDTGRSGLWMLISFVPLVGFLAMLIFTLQDSDPDANEYGESPKYVSLAVV